MRTTVLKATATVALFVSGMTGALAQLRFDTAPSIEKSAKEVLPRLEETIQKLDIPEADKSILTSALTLNPRIVGGHPTSIEENPWQVALIRGLVAEPARSQFCGGSIIAPDWVITAAHCVDNFIVNKLPARVNIVAGVARYKSGGERVAVKRIFVHKAWNSATMDNDIALLQLSRRLKLTGSLRTIAWAAGGTAIADGTHLTVTGWGAIAEGGPGSDNLLGVTVPLVSNSVCNHPDSYDGRVTGNMFCAGLRHGGLDSCQGDSGGPIWTNIQGVETLVGLVSFGDGCARKLKYGIYTRVANYDEWVQQTMRAAREGTEESRAERTTVADELQVNETEWSQLSQSDKEAIETILRESRLIQQDAAIVPRSDSPRLMGDERGWLTNLLKPVASFACKRGCEATAAAAISACAQLTSGIGAPVCVGLAGRGEELCKKRCR